MNQLVAFFLPSLRGGGAERVMLHLAAGFAERGWRTELVLAAADGPYLDEAPASVGIVDLRAPRMARAILGLARYLNRTRPRALISAMHHANVAAVLARSLSTRRTPVVATIHNPSTAQNLLHSQFSLRSIRGSAWRMALRTAYQRAEYVVAVSHGLADASALALGLDRAAVRVIYNPIVSDDLLHRGNDPLRDPWFGAGQPPVVLAVGRLVEAKDHETLVRAFALLRRVRPARLVILGEGPRRHGLERLAEELGVSSDVALPGFVQNPYPFMKRAAVMALSSRWEGFGNVLVEAMALGTTVVSTACAGGPPEILEDGKWGRLVPVGDPPALAAAISAAIDDPGPDATARAWRFSIDRAVAAYASLVLPGGTLIADASDARH